MKKVAWLVSSTALITTATVFAGWPDAAQVDRLPTSTNAIMAINVRGAYASPMGVRNEWSQRFAQTGHASLGSLPPSVETMLVASQFDFSRLHPIWQLGLANTRATLDAVARSESGVVTQIGGQTAVESPRGVLFSSAGNWQLSVFAPADRQAFARWLRGPARQGNGGTLTYLRKAIESPGTAQAVVAVDLADTVDPEGSRLYLSALPTAVTNRLDAGALSRLFTGIQGFTLRITVTDSIVGQLQVDFSSNIGALSQFLPALLEDLLADAGAALHDLKGWKPSFTGNSMTLEGPLSEGSMRKIISLFELPGGPGPELESPGAPASGTTANATATLRYFRSITDMLGELRRVHSDLKDEQAYDRFALWFENFARKIDYLPVLNVDPDMIAFGKSTSSTLRGIGASLRGVPIRTREAGQGAFMFFSGVSQGGWRRSPPVSATNVNTNINEVWQQQAKIVAEDAEARTAAWKTIDDNTAAIRTKMSERFRIVF